MTCRRLSILVAVLLTFASISAAQLPQLRGGGRVGGRGGGYIPWARLEDFDGAFVYCRLYYDSHPWGSGGSWSTDFPNADRNLPFRLSELTTTTVGRDPGGEYRHLVVAATDPLIYHCPVVMAFEPGRLDFSAAEAAALRAYLLKGGFLWMDDFWGSGEWANAAEQISGVLSPSQYPIVDLPLDHPIFHAVYDIRQKSQIPSINFWLGTGGATSERGFDSAEVHIRGISDEHGRLMVVMTHNTDFGDSFEREGDNHQYFLAFAGQGYAFGVNLLVHALSH